MRDSVKYNSRINKRSYLYLFLLLAYSGNPFFVSTKMGSYFFICISLLLFIRHRKWLDVKYNSTIHRYAGFFLIIFICQYIVFDFISILGVLNFILKIFFGYLMIRYLGGAFRLFFFKTITIISLISLLGYLFNVLGYQLPEFTLLDDHIKSIIIFNQKHEGGRNSGMFWEPGAFASFINLCFLLYFNQLKILYKEYKYHVLILVLALLTTYSTTGYFVLFLIALLSYFHASKGIKKIIFIFPGFLIVLSAFLLYDTLPFLRQKVEGQYENTMSRENNEFSPDRMGVFLFDLHYIKKHPLIGNGLHSKTRYQDHPWLMNENLGHGNGFSNFLASMGILSFLFYCIVILKYFDNSALYFILIFTIMLNGEQLLNFPLFLALPLLGKYGNFKINNKNSI